MIRTEDFIEAAVHKFAAPRPTKTIFAGGKRMEVHQPGERVLHLPNGQVVKVTTDDSGCATQVEDEESLHAVARPKPYRMTIRRD